MEVSSQARHWGSGIWDSLCAPSLVGQVANKFREV